MTAYDAARERLNLDPRTWTITGVAGFIGCNLLEALLRLDQRVIGLDNFATGRHRNLDAVRAAVGDERWSRFMFMEGDIRELEVCQAAVKTAEIVLHEAALGSVPRSVADPIRTNQANIDGFLNMLVASRDAGVRRFIYAASSSTYGDHPGLPKVEDRIGKPLSPYAVTKYVNELYADVFKRVYDLDCVGLRYFNVFGPHQDPEGPYAAVIPRWIAAMLSRQVVRVNGDGSTSRDFCFVENVVQANVLAATTTDEAALNQVYNVAAGERTTLNGLYGILRDQLQQRVPDLVVPQPEHGDFRAGDVRHSLADLTKVRTLLGYEPTHTVARGLGEAVEWYLRHVAD